MSDKRTLYQSLVDLCPDFELKGKANLYTSANGHMFSQLNKEQQLGIRFSKEVQQKYMEEWGSAEFRSYNAVMRGYVLVPEEFWTDLTGLAGYLQESYQYVMSLDPK